jgi:MYXO-CTERM domain-containing protein
MDRDGRRVRGLCPPPSWPGILGGIEVNLMRRLALASLLASGVIMVAACADDGGVYDPDDLGSSEDEIINGQIDTTHDAVVAIFDTDAGAGCTGTIISINGSDGYVLTAAHCFEFGGIDVAVVGDDYQAAQQVLNVANWQTHPQWNPNDLTYDFAMMRVSGVAPGTPIIPALTAAEDDMTVGTTVDHVGYGLVSYPNGQTSQRHHILGQLSQLAQLQIAYDQPTSGPCSGDSGGPNLYTTPNGERVAGVISYGDQECQQVGVSGRVSAVYAGFIAPFIGDPTSSSSSTTSSTTGQGGAGVGPGPTVGAGGASADDEWVAGTLKNQRFEDSSCASVPGSAGSRAAWLVLGLCLAGLVRSRRRR